MAYHQRPLDFKVQLHGLLDDLRASTLDEITRLQRLYEATQEQSCRRTKLRDEDQVKDFKEQFHCMLETLRDTTMREVVRLEQSVEASRFSNPLVVQERGNETEEWQPDLIEVDDRRDTQRIVELETQIDDALKRTVETELCAMNELSGLSTTFDVISQCGHSEMTLGVQGGASTASLGSVHSNASRCIGQMTEETMHLPNGPQDTLSPQPPSNMRVVREPRRPATVAHSKSSPNKVKRNLQSSRPGRRAHGAGMPLPAKGCVNLALGLGEELVTSMERLRAFLEQEQNGGLTMAFRRINVSRTGKLTCREIGAGFERIGVPRSMASAIFRRLAQLAKCPEKQGFLTHEEWLIGFAKVGTQARTDAAVDAVAKLHLQSSARAFTPTRREGAPNKSPFVWTV